MTWLVLFNHQVPLILAKVVHNVLGQYSVVQNANEYKSIQNNQSMFDHHMMNNSHVPIS